MDRNSAAGSPGKGPTAALALGGAAEGPQWASRVVIGFQVSSASTFGTLQGVAGSNHPPSTTPSFQRAHRDELEDMEDTTHRITSTKTILKTHVL